MLNQIKKDLAQLGDPEKAKNSRWFFKTGKGQYGEGDIFLGIPVPEQRKVAKKYADLSLADIQELLSSEIHEHRFTALVILISKYRKTEETIKKEIFNFYLKNTENINNWDLVDLSAPRIVGDYLLNKERSILYKLAKSDSLWERRISILATFAFIVVDNDFYRSLFKLHRDPLLGSFFFSIFIDQRFNPFADKFGVVNTFSVVNFYSRV